MSAPTPGSRLGRELARLAGEGALFAHVVRSWPLRDSPGRFQVEVGCPLCGFVHLHGAGSDARGVVGHRVEHCSLVKNPRAAEGYVIVDLRDRRGAPAPGQR